MLLIHSLQDRPAKVVRIAYYISLAWAVAWAATGIAKTISNFSAEYLIIAILLIFIGSVLIPLGFYKLATRLDRRE